MPPNDRLRRVTEDALRRLRDLEPPAAVLPRHVRSANAVVETKSLPLKASTPPAPTKEPGRRDIRRVVATAVAVVAALGTIAEAIRRLFELFPLR